MSGRQRPRTAAVLGIDGGGSKVDVALVARDGTVLAATRVAHLDHDGTGRDRHLEGVLAAVAATCRSAGRDLGHGPVATVAVACMAGADLPADDRRIGRWLAAQGWAGTPILRNDTFAVLRAGTDRGWGVAVVCGYGTNCSGVSPSGRTFRFPAVGTVSGDWGGGHDVGSAALWYALRAQDGRGDETALATLVPAHFGMRRPRQVMEGMYFGRLDGDRVVELAPLVFRAATEGDAVARRIVDRQADEVALMATTAIRRLRMTRLDVDVVLGGGIFRNEDPPFHARVLERILAVAPSARVVRLAEPPVVGAVLLGLDAIGAPKGAAVRVRAALTHERMSREGLRTKAARAIRTTAMSEPLEVGHGRNRA